MPKGDRGGSLIMRGEVTGSLAGDSGAGRRRRQRPVIQWRGSTRRGVQGWEANASRVDWKFAQD